MLKRILAGVAVAVMQMIGALLTCLASIGGLGGPGCQRLTHRST